MAIKDTLTKRGKSHGNFTDNARILQEIKKAMYAGIEEAGRLTPEMYEALDMIAHKIGRIIAGNAAHKDHWHDIAGYATLVEERL